MFFIMVAFTPAQSQDAAPVVARRHEIIQGTITGAGAKPVQGAEVIATRAPDRAFQSAHTDAAGKYVIDWPEGTGDYLVHVSAAGYEPFRKRATRTASDSILIVDAGLSPVEKAQQLAAVVTTARKPKPSRDPAFGPDVGAAEQLSGGMVGKLAPDVAGDLSAIAATLPGVMPTSGGISVLGLGADQNSTTLNGMAFQGADIPRDANTRVRVSTSAYDPSRGWFSGANTNVELAPGTLFGGRRSHVTLDAPALQYTDPVSARLGQRFTSGQVSLGEDGELVEDKWYYNLGVQGGRRVAPVASLLTADADLLRHAGLASDSASRLLGLLNTAGVPLSLGNTSANAVTDNLSFIGRFDHTPFDPVTLGAAKTTWGFTTYGKVSRTNALGFSPTATPAHGGESANEIGSLQAQYSTFFGADYLADVRSSLSFTHDRTSPYASLPDGRVRIESDNAGISSAQFGGNGALVNDAKRWTWENASDIQFYASNTPAHRVKLSTDLRLDGYSIAATPNPLGTFAYNSLSDLAANTPASFTRTLNGPQREGAEWNAFVALGDLWRVNPSWQLLYGARIEGNAFTSAPAHNAQVEQLFGARTDVAPGGIHVSPRLGFTYNKSAQVRNSVIQQNLGRFTGTTPGVLRGGIGEFRGLTPAGLLSNALVTTGLPAAQSRLSCIGSAVPRPDWRAYQTNSGSIPTSCAGGASSFDDTAPGVILLDPSWSTARSWRSNLAWSSVFSRFNYTLEGIYALNLGQPGSSDLNFGGTPRFTLADEGRPMFADASHIVTGTGLVSAVDARLSSAYGRVTSVRNDGRSVSKQATLTVSPDLTSGSFSNYYVAASYTLGSTRVLQRGFDATTFGAPTERSWNRGDLDARHQLLLQGGYAAPNGITFTLLGRLQSGLPFTPMVGSDVNGDGLANDRAYVPDPSRTSDPLLASGLRALIGSSSTGVRDCLTSQFAMAAGAASCEGPWTTTLNARIGIAGTGSVLSRRVNIGLNFANPLGGLDQLLHGADNMHGWGAPAVPDPVLLSVRGWDAAAQRFQYSVNPRFGDTRSASTTLRAPFRLTLDVSIDIGRPTEEQQVDRWLKPGRGGRGGLKADVQELKRRYDRNVPDLYGIVMQQADSLLLSREQVEAIQKARVVYRAQMDSVWTTLATYLAGLPDQYNSAVAYSRASDGIDGAWELTRTALKRDLPAILNPVQIQLVPGVVKTLLDSTGPLHIRVFITGG
ncbi:MAG: carboxypeptidase-like regulatory domain-containing protein [bacterium]